MSLMHRVKGWWDEHPLRILISFSVAALGAFALIWGLFSDDPPIPELVEALKGADAMPSPIQIAGLALLLLAVGGQIALLVVVLLRHRVEEQRLHDDLGLVVGVLRRLAEPDEAMLRWQREQESLAAAREEEEDERRRLRRVAQLRGIEPFEVGLKVRELPRGVYCFVDTLGLVERRRIPQAEWEPDFRGDLTFARKIRHASARRASRLEVHLDSSGRVFLVGFVPALDAADIENGQAQEARLYTSRVEYAPVAVRVEVERVDRATELETSPPHLSLVLKPPKDPPPTKSGS